MHAMPLWRAKKLYSCAYQPHPRFRAFIIFIAQHEIFFRKHRKKDLKYMLTTDINIAFITFIKSSLTAVILFCQLAIPNK